MLPVVQVLHDVAVLQRLQSAYLFHDLLMQAGLLDGYGSQSLLGRQVVALVDGSVAAAAELLLAVENVVTVALVSFSLHNPI